MSFGSPINLFPTTHPGNDERIRRAIDSLPLKEPIVEDYWSKFFHASRYVFDRFDISLEGLELSENVDYRDHLMDLLKKYDEVRDTLINGDLEW